MANKNEGLLLFDEKITPTHLKSKGGAAKRGKRYKCDEITELIVGVLEKNRQPLSLKEIYQKLNRRYSQGVIKRHLRAIKKLEGKIVSVYISNNKYVVSIIPVEHRYVISDLAGKQTEFLPTSVDLQ